MTEQLGDRQHATGPASGPAGLGHEALDELMHLRADFARFLLEYQFGIEEMKTKIEILRLEFVHLHEHNPIEHVGARLKSPSRSSPR